MIVCPGGGYGGLADHEGAPVAQGYADNGYHAFVLTYRTADDTETPLGSRPLYDACTAIGYVRSQASHLGISPDTIAICGFSAGGHLAASAGTLWHKTELYGGILPATEYLPNSTILCYPVITAVREYTHLGTFTNLLGGDSSLYEGFSLEKQVTEKTAPAFLWHTAADQGVPVANSLCYGEALARHKIPFELHVYPYGPHGIGLATAESGSGTHDPYAARWFAQSVRWLDLQFAR